MKKLLITIDGPAGAGKTTVSRQLAERLEYTYIDTGALYRAVAHEAHAKGIGADDDKGLEQLCQGLEIAFVRKESGLRLMCNRVDITDQIRTPEITMLASAVSARPVVREFLLGLQREMGQKKGVVFEGRDMGTVVFPEADVKFKCIGRYQSPQTLRRDGRKDHRDAGRSYRGYQSPGSK